ncbi:MAG: ketopantoate reductase family protein [Anaerolineaceae bacterium]|nr:ketopantoate reductase family protein [Anaerolineaceae bacterium]
MKMAIMGSGGVGGYYGALLASCGNDVTFIARGAHLSAMREHGLQVQSIHGDLHLAPVQATDDPARVGPVDLVLVAVKTYDLEQAAQAARPLVGPNTSVLPLLNGLDAAERLAAVLGDGNVLGGMTHISSSVAAPGVIRQVSPLRRITLGECDGTITARAEAVRDVLAATGAEVALTPRIDVALWEKFLFIASIGGICCLARQPMGPVLATAETRQLYTQALLEIEALAHARGVDLPDGAVDNALQLTAGFAPGTKPSMLADLEAGRRLELEAMSGTVVRYGRETGVPTPVHWAVYAALKPSAAGAA